MLETFYLSHLYLWKIHPEHITLIIIILCCYELDFSYLTNRKDGLFQTEVYKIFEAEYHAVVPFQQVLPTNFMNEKMGALRSYVTEGWGGTFTGNIF